MRDIIPFRLKSEKGTRRRIRLCRRRNFCI